MTTEKTVTTATDSPGVTRPGLALAVIAGAQFMVVLDGTIMNIALSSIQQAFDMSGVLLAWVVNAYALAFGGFLLLGGRLGDVLGRVAIFRVGLVLFAGASLLGGLAWSQEVLIGARVLQGMGAAIVAPAALALIATSFEGQARGRAMGLYGAMAGLGSTAGLLFGGVLTSYASWRWVLLVNIPIAVALFLGARYLRSGERHHSELNVPSAVLGTLGVTSLVYAITRSGEHGWGDPASIALYGAAAVFIGVFVVAQDRVAHPLLPLAILRDRTRAGANVAMLLLGTGMFATYYFFTLYMQQVLGYSAIESALAYLPWATAIFVGSGVLAPRLLPRLPRRRLRLRHGDRGAHGGDGPRPGVDLRPAHDLGDVPRRRPRLGCCGGGHEHRPAGGWRHRSRDARGPGHPNQHRPAAVRGPGAAAGRVHRGRDVARLRPRGTLGGIHHRVPRRRGDLRPRGGRGRADRAP
ncbi:MFS transporter [Aeromicrobium sp. REDSEA-S32_B7]|uniref:MFS transporter n=1 Tax=Aeromicrobium sp. REDSEA-S32_B7 TaxID=1811526 RepID=UPI000AF38137|nr:MFS transporter [Aeromicrobium sp. REDSEA-S32_B7]